MPSENSKSVRSCPECGSNRITRSRRTTVDRFVCLLNRKPFRCGSCRKRFHLASADGRQKKERERGASRARKRLARCRELAVYLCALAAFAIAAFMITQERG